MDLEIIKKFFERVANTILIYVYGLRSAFNLHIQSPSVLTTNEK